MKVIMVNTSSCPEGPLLYSTHCVGQNHSVSIMPTLHGPESCSQHPASWISQKGFHEFLLAFLFDGNLAYPFIDFIHSTGIRHSGVSRRSKNIKRNSKSTHLFF